MLRRTLLTLVCALFVLLVGLPVLLGGYGLATATHNEAAAPVLWWCLMANLMLVAADILLLVAALGIASLVQLEERHSGPERAEADSPTDR